MRVIGKVTKLNRDIILHAAKSCQDRQDLAASDLRDEDVKTIRENKALLRIANEKIG